MRRKGTGICDESRRGILKIKWRKGERWEDRRGRGRSCVVVQGRERVRKGEGALDCEEMQVVVEGIGRWRVSE